MKHTSLTVFFLKENELEKWFELSTVLRLIFCLAKNCPACWGSLFWGLSPFFSSIKCWVYLPMPWFNAHVLEQCNCLLRECLKLQMKIHKCPLKRWIHLPVKILSGWGEILGRSPRIFCWVEWAKMSSWECWRAVWGYSGGDEGGGSICEF